MAIAQKSPWPFPPALRHRIRACSSRLIPACAAFLCLNGGVHWVLRAQGIPNKPDVAASVHDQIQDLVGRLGSAVYADRQAASNALLELGPEVRPILLARIPGAEREVELRLKTLVAILDVESTGSFSDSLQVVAIEFPDQPRELQAETISHLFDAEHFRLIFTLLDRIPDPEAAIAASDSFEMNELLECLICKQDWDQLEEILEHPVCRRLYPEFLVAWWMTSGQVDPRIAQLQEDLENDPASEETARLLLSLFRFAGRLEDAADLIGSHPKLTEDPGLVEDLWVERGEWVKLLDLDVRPCAQLSGPELGRRLVLAQLAGRSDLALECRGVIDQRLRDLPGDSGAEADSESAIGMARGLFLTGEIGRAIEVLSRVNPTEAATIATFLNRFRDAEAALGVGPTIDERLQWIERRVRSMRSSTARYDRSGEQSAARDSDKAFESLMALARLMENQGQEAPVRYLLRLAAGSIRPDTYSADERLAQLIGLAFQMRDAALTQELCGQFWTHEYSLFELTSVLFPGKEAEANTLMIQAESLESAPLEQLISIARILNEPVFASSHSAPFEISDELISQLVSAHPSKDEFSVSRPYDAYFLARICQFHRRWEAMRQHREAAIANSVPQALAWQASELADQGAWQAAAALDEKVSTDALADRDQATRSALRAAWARRLTGEGLLAARQQFAAFVYARKLGSLTELSRSASESAWGPVLEECLRMELAVNPLRPGLIDARMLARQRYLQRHNLLSSMKYTAAKLDPQWELVQAMLFDLTDRDSISANWYCARMGLHYLALQAMRMYRAGEIEAAEELLQRHVREHPADASLAEEFLVELIDGPHSESGNRIVRQLENSFQLELSQNPRSALLLNNFAWANVCCRTHPELSLQMARRAVELRPRYASYLDTLAALEFWTGNLAAAQELTEQCLELQPDRVYYQQQWQRLKALQK